MPTREPSSRDLASERIKSLVFIAALAPDEGETVADMFYRLPAHPDTAKPEQARMLAAVQRPISVACIQQPMPKPGWKTKPSWFLVAEEDGVIDPETQHFMARRMKAQIHLRKADHTPLITAPGDAVKIIHQAVETRG